jgi:DNA-binding MarR family transcriptional regulator
MGELAALDRRLVFLLHRAARAAIGHASRRLLERVGVSVAQLAIVTYVARRPACPMTELAKVLDVNRSAVTTAVRRLERARLIRRRANPRDARGALLTLTAKGERVRRAARPVFRSVMTDLTRDITRAEREVVLRFLGSLVNRFGTEPTKEE